MKNILFVCSQNKLRSPTAEQVFLKHGGCNVRSAGLNNDANYILSSEDVEWADMIFVMEKSHRNKLTKKYSNYLRSKRVICLNIPDDYEYMDEKLIRIFENMLPRYLK